MTDLGPVPDDHPQVVAHRTAMAKDNAGLAWENWPHKVTSSLDGGGTWTITCPTCVITWKKLETRRGGYHGD